jgi:hypothetical protein
MDIIEKLEEVNFVSELYQAEGREVLQPVIGLKGNVGFRIPRAEKAIPAACCVAADQAVVLTVWGAKWLKHAWNYVADGGTSGQVAKEVLINMDACNEDPLDYVETHVYNHEHKIIATTDGVQKEEVLVTERVKKVLRKGGRSKFSAAIAKQAYNKFGERPMSQANILVTRKWLQKLLAEPEYKDLRTCDKNIAIDRALFLSFVPTKDFLKMKMAVATRPWEKRVTGAGMWGFWDRVFAIGPISGLDGLDNQ